MIYLVSKLIPVRNRLVGPLIALIAACIFSACSAPPATDTQTVDTDTTVFINADILTLNDSQPSAEALAVRDGVILAVGGRAEVDAAAGANPIIRDLQGKTILPGLIDAHGHLMLSALFSTMADLQPAPAGTVSNIAELTAALEAWKTANPDAPWILGFGYDDSLLAEQRHPTREDLDAVSAERPIMLFHVSGHLLSCNSVCLERAGIDANTPNPPGGVIRRQPESEEPDGVLEELAMQPVFATLPQPSPAQMAEAVQNVQANYAARGITTVQEGAGRPAQIQGLAALAEAGALNLDVVAFQLVRDTEAFASGFGYSQNYNNHFRIGGIKLVLDGSPQGKTAWLTHPFHQVPEGLPADYVGYPAMETKTVNAVVDQAYANAIPVLAHANGDAAGDQLLGAVTSARETHGAADRRTVMIHAQTVRDDQIALMKAEGVIPSYFVAHTFFWGDWHRDSVLGPERAARISPLASSLASDLTFTIHNDAPVIPPDMMRLLWTAVNRQTRSGQVLGPNERISAMDALRAVTLDAAYQYFEEDEKGSLEIGKRADLVVLSANPTTIAPESIKDIEILETVKDGKTVFTASPDQ